MKIIGAKKGQNQSRTPVVAPDSAQSRTYIKILYGLGEGEIMGLANGYKSVYLDDTPLQNDSGEFNFSDVKVDFRAGTNDQTYIDGFADVASETAVNVELKHGTPFVKAFNNLDLDAVRVRLKWGALRSQNAENGDVSGVKIEYAIDVKTDNGGWVETLKTAINAKTSDAYERSPLDQLTTRVSTAEGKITAETQKVSILQTTVSGQTASLQTLQNSMNGVKAEYAIKVDNGGRVAGIGLIGTPNLAG